MNVLKRKKVLVCSDTHGRNDRLERLLKDNSFDALYFLGDGEGLEKELAALSGCPAELILVRGNNDYVPGLKESAVTELGMHRIFLTHGHGYHLYFGYALLEEAARERSCDICLFGHLHRPVWKEEEGILFLNPGSLSQPRQDSGIPTCLILETTENGELKISFRNAETNEELDSGSVVC